MTDLLVRNIPGPLMDRLKAQARRNDRSVQREALAVLEAGTQLAMEEWLKLAEASQAASRKWGPLADSTALIREDRDGR